ncbi:MAG: response regulator transcription factor, partial [Planctomycetales bacterium]
MLPGMSGYETCTSIRESGNAIPILVLSARTLSEDKAHAFACGTDQYMTKPFALPELLSRVRNLLERRTPLSDSASVPENENENEEQFEFADIRVDFRQFEVTVDATVHQLTTMEMQLLRSFIKHEGAVLSRAQMMEDVWGLSPDVTSRTIDNFVMRLRRVIETNPAEPRRLVSVRGTGYRFVANPDASEE